VAKVSIHHSALTGLLSAAGVWASAVGRGRLMNKVFIERLWRWLADKFVYLLPARCCVPN
jgi:hypothetical protein